MACITIYSTCLYIHYYLTWLAAWRVCVCVCAEADMVSHFEPGAVVDWARRYDPSRLIDTNSGGPANNLGLGDVNDTHDCEQQHY
jgi:hypothetical protein